jgi:hypothetical protein
MIWVGTTTISRPQEAQSAISQGNLTRDWACAMPPVSVRCYSIWTIDKLELFCGKVECFLLRILVISGV